MASIREDCLVNFAALVAAIAGITVERNRDIEVQEFPTAIVTGGDETGDDEVMNATLVVKMTILVEVYVRGAAVDTQLNAWRASIKDAIAADPTLSGKAVHTRYRGMDEPEPVTEDVDEAHLVAELGFECEYHELEGDSSTLG